MNKHSIITALLFLAAGLGAGYWWATLQQIETQPAPPSSTPSAPPLFYRNPMNPSVTSPVPAKDAMGMDYVPVYADDANGATAPSGTVKIDPVTEQNIGVRTAVATRETLSHIVRAVGRVAYDEERLVRLHPKTEGWIETLNIDKTGEWVKKNEDLLSIYSPQLVTSQQEYILALNNLKVLENSPIEDIRRGAEELVKSSLERLKLLDVPEHQLHDLTHSHKIKKSLHIHTPEAGIVMNIGAREGQYVTPATELYMIADLSTVWVYADIYEYELPWIKVGDPVEMRLAGVPGRVFKGRLAFIYPYAEPKTRTIKVRLIFDNSALLLKPDMFAELTIFAGKNVETITIPSESVIRSGARNQVFVVRAPGKFEPRTVTLGLSSNGKAAVLDGVNAGERVVISAQFLIDSESKLREAATKMVEPNESGGSMNMNQEPADHPPSGDVEKPDSEMEDDRSGAHRHD
ncbi:efflux RND transporter periplasmic adaptor subunit [Methylomarinum sp. Ch1-1]|uniref:Efflux RND transporter periplasmic adaptor subunit n=1 Tax=Methylomarinum roseum TaxID=3067653 RepID=A0AAU7NYE3_9GAMM|nr:efflux RND transporter periplasmic adaptor subunit [Methylomarinum sp. Ch1-1]MDP4521891.1 efflux RND transporter periplasmic adaptor subunit [Methylomarinum sp. Ch1-1]